MTSVTLDLESRFNFLTQDPHPQPTIIMVYHAVLAAVLAAKKMPPPPPPPTMEEVYGGVALVSCAWIFMAYIFMPMGPTVGYNRP